MACELQVDKNYIYNSLLSEIAINNPLDAPKVDVAQS